MTSFYKRFIRGFSTIMAQITSCLKGEKFKWTSEAQDHFEVIKGKVTKASCLVLPDFNKVFEVECYASLTVVDPVLSQEGKRVAFFSEKFSDARKKYSTYDRELYAIYRALSHWSQYIFTSLLHFILIMRL